MVEGKMEVRINEQSMFISNTDLFSAVKDLAEFVMKHEVKEFGSIRNYESNRIRQLTSKVNAA